MQNKWIKYAFIASIVDCIILSFVHLEAFFTERFQQDLIDSFTLPFYTIPLIFLVLHLIANIKSKSYKPNNQSFAFLNIVAVLYYTILILFVAAIGLLIYNMLKQDSKTLLQTTQYVIVEICAITLAIQTQRKKKVEKLIFLFLLWTFTIMATYSLLGFFEQYVGYTFSNDLYLIFAGIFFHLGNACFIVYLKAVED